MNLFITTGAIFGALAIILGAFGAHALKKIFSEDQLKNFETGVKYKMSHALLLVVLGFNIQLITQYQNLIYYALTWGILLFSFSIYGLCISSALNKKLKFLGPLTPTGAPFLLLRWISLLFHSLT